MPGSSPPRCAAWRVTPGEIEDLTQEVFVRLCRNDFRLLRSYDPARAGLTTWMTIVSRSTARDASGGTAGHGADRRGAGIPAGRRSGRAGQKLKLPEALLSPRQREILTMLYDREMEVAEIARALGIDPQSVRSAHHKAMVKLRAHFKADAQ